MNTTFLNRSSSSSTVYSINSYKDGIHTDSGYYSHHPPVTRSPLISRRVFLGGLPRFFTGTEIQRNLSEFGQVYVDWPSKDAGKQPSGFCFVEFEDEYQVFRYLVKCQMFQGRFLNHVCLGRKIFQVECKPFFLKNSKFGYDNGSDVDTRSVFLGGLPRETTALDLQQLLSVYGKVTRVVIDLDNMTNYPRGTATVTFERTESVKAAIYARVVQYFPSNSRVCRNIEIKPHIPCHRSCSHCGVGELMVFCMHPDCMKAMCNECWYWTHQNVNHFSTRIFRNTYYTGYEERKISL